MVDLFAYHSYRVIRCRADKRAIEFNRENKPAQQKLSNNSLDESRFSAPQINQPAGLIYELTFSWNHLII